MTPTEIETAARNQYNAIGDSFWSQAEILNLIWQACIELADLTKNIERTYTTSTVASQQEYSYPTSTVAIKRITYGGKKLQPITMREDDAITGLNQSTTDEGTPQYYFIWNDTIYLRPIPSAVGTLKIFSINKPQQVTTTSTIEVPDQFHMALVDYILSRMASKDRQLDVAKYYLDLWKETKIEAIKWHKRNKRGDSFASVQDEEQMNGSYLGLV